MIAGALSWIIGGAVGVLAAVAGVALVARHRHRRLSINVVVERDDDDTREREP